MSRKILVLYAHPAPSQSEANAPLAAAAAAIPGVTMVDLYAEYPRFDIDAPREQKRLRDHDAVVFQYPLYWYSTPALLKQWQDCVLEHGYAYGPEADAVAGKLFFCALTTGGPEAAFRSDMYGHVGMRKLLAPLEQAATLCGMVWLPPFALFGAGRASHDGRLEAHLSDWRRLLIALRDNTLDINRARRAARLNDAAQKFPNTQAIQENAA